MLGNCLILLKIQGSVSLQMTYWCKLLVSPVASALLLHREIAAFGIPAFVILTTIWVFGAINILAVVRDRP
jgi:hypothetical protein